MSVHATDMPESQLLIEVLISQSIASASVMSNVKPSAYAHDKFPTVSLTKLFSVAVAVVEDSLVFDEPSLYVVTVVVVVTVLFFV